VPLLVIRRQLGHSYASTASVYLQGIDVEKIIATIHARRGPMVHVSAGLEL
jgi:formate hydrogenlyase subunit 4